MNKLFRAHLLRFPCAILLFVPYFFPSCASSQTVFSQLDAAEIMLDQMEQNLTTFSAASTSRLSEARAVPVEETGISESDRGGYADAAHVFEGRRAQEMEKTLRKFEIEFALDTFFTRGEQKFEVITDDGALLSRLKYRNDGVVPVARGEVRYDRFSIGGRYGSGALEKKQNTDEDWGIVMRINGIPTLVDYTISTQYCKPKIVFYDTNLYYRLLDRAEAGEFMGTSAFIDTVSFDIFGGYQYYKGRYLMVDPMVSRYIYIGSAVGYDTSLPADIGLNSSYKVIYQGPRIGARFTGVKGSLSTTVSFAYAFLTTKAHGYWNLRDYAFTQESSGNGYGADLAIETDYALTPAWSVGLGYHFIGLYQKKMTESGTQPGSTFEDLDIIRNVENTTYGISLALKYIW